ncbi:MAG: hypothetical protein COT71_00630 [Candidatus Andersenbacteria bacterium CG10_big_fil_rev_8_21_14_0_10_54_11]|uniref:L-threonylcarbamoyladenylate synthase n=1 Tax=Candidatus Andersenbacteria bacterium CG10_big_fil_rev_8_21_14_0_10_54_11 TaxID=1974485 RepID=A0A2M6X0D6_9BACT|nr:MAG: hypothetical protein COT71_00630 [Candidatus Andersenbacteria bacterium CG10_big_fil_rev_8_21_14_0_10_54_11]
MEYTLLTADTTAAAEAIAAGRVAAVPTGTSYALAADALQGMAIQRVKQLKGRPPEKPFSVFLDAAHWDEFLRLTVDEQALLQTFAARPLTLLVAPAPDLAHLALDGRVALRTIDRPEMQQLAEQLAVPLTATSANKSGQPACRDAQCVLDNFPGRIDESTYDLSLAVIIDGGRLPEKPPTTIAKIEGNNISILRQGEITAEEVQRALAAQ